MKAGIRKGRRLKKQLARGPLVAMRLPFLTLITVCSTGTGARAVSCPPWNPRPKWPLPTCLSRPTQCTAQTSTPWSCPKPNWSPTNKASLRASTCGWANHPTGRTSQQRKPPTLNNPTSPYNPLALHTYHSRAQHNTRTHLCNLFITRT